MTTCGCCDREVEEVHAEVDLAGSAYDECLGCHAAGCRNDEFSDCLLPSPLPFQVDDHVTALRLVLPEPPKFATVEEADAWLESHERR